MSDFATYVFESKNKDMNVLKIGWEAVDFYEVPLTHL